MNTNITNIISTENTTKEVQVVSASQLALSLQLETEKNVPFL